MINLAKANQLHQEKNLGLEIYVPQHIRDNSGAWRSQHKDVNSGVR